MALTEIPSELSSTPSIVDNGNATAITIDSSERVLIGKTATGLGASGTEINPNGYIQVTEDQSPPLYLNRLSTSGSIVNFYKDGTTVGSIGTGSSLLTIGTGTGNLVFADALVAPCSDSSAGSSNGVVNLGATNRRFKDLHMSGKAYMTGLEPGQVTITQGSYFIGNAAAGYRFNNAADTLNLMILKDNGDLMVGATAAYFARFTVQGEANQNAVTVRVGTNGYPAINFQNTSGAQQGYIVTNASSVSLVSVSDQRLKQNIADADDAGSKLDAIQVRQFDWIADGSHQEYGMVAQELQIVAPEAVHQPADSEKMMGVDYSKLVPMLVKEIQSLRTRVQELENN